jgi:hypothetical protein
MHARSRVPKVQPGENNDSADAQGDEETIPAKRTLDAAVEGGRNF